MASIHKKTGASGKVSPYWHAKFRGQDGQILWRSTKQTDPRKAMEVAKKWEKAARLASMTELTQAASMRLLDELMETTTGEHLNVQTIDAYFGEWIKGKTTTGAAAG